MTAPAVGGGHGMTGGGIGGSGGNGGRTGAGTSNSKDGSETSDTTRKDTTDTIERQDDDTIERQDDDRRHEESQQQKTKVTFTPYDRWYYYRDDDVTVLRKERHQRTSSAQWREKQRISRRLRKSQTRDAQQQRQRSIQLPTHQPHTTPQQENETRQQRLDRLESKIRDIQQTLHALEVQKMPSKPHMPVKATPPPPILGCAQGNSEFPIRRTYHDEGPANDTPPTPLKNTTASVKNDNPPPLDTTGIGTHPCAQSNSESPNTPPNPLNTTEDNPPRTLDPIASGIHPWAFLDALFNPTAPGTHPWVTRNPLAQPFLKTFIAANLEAATARIQHKQAQKLLHQQLPLPCLVHMGDQQASDKEKMRLASMRQMDRKMRDPYAFTYFDSVLDIHRNSPCLEHHRPTSILKPAKLKPMQQTSRKRVTFRPRNEWRDYEPDGPRFVCYYYQPSRYERATPGPTWRQHQSTKMQQQGQPFEEVKWRPSYLTPRVKFGWVQTEGNNDRISLEAYSENTTTSRQWRLRAFQPKDIRQWEPDERVLWNHKMTTIRQETAKQAKVQRNEEDCRFRQYLQESNQHQEAQRQQYRETLHSLDLERHRQLTQTRQKRQALKLHGQKQSLASMQDSPITPNAPSTTQWPPAIPSFAPPKAVSHIPPPRTYRLCETGPPPHRKVVRKKKTSTLPAPASPICHTVWPLSPLWTTTCLQSLHRERGHLRSLQFFPLPTSLSQHHAWVSPAHRKILRQQPFV